MGLIFNKDIAAIYQAWHRSHPARLIDRSLEKLIFRLVGPSPGERVLDIGCGSGNHLLMFSKMGLNVSGIDASSHMISLARERLSRRCLLNTCRAEDLPFDDNEFDLAVLINTVEFLDDPVQVLREAGRVTRKKIFIGVLNSLSWNGLLKKIQGVFGNQVFGQAKFYNLWQIKALVKKVYGDVPISWACIRMTPSCVTQVETDDIPFWQWEHSPFGFFLGITVTIRYMLRTESFPLKLGLEKASKHLVGIETFEDLVKREGTFKDERGIPV